MAQQQYEYKTVEAPLTSRHDIGNIQPVLTDHAVDGWQLSETVESQGETAAFIFERPVDTDTT